jgi:hypothetical protein
MKVGLALVDSVALSASIVLAGNSGLPSQLAEIAKAVQG